MKYLDRITFNPKQCGGRPCIRGMRIRVKDALDLLAAAVPESEILEDFPYLQPEDIRACHVPILSRIPWFLRPKNRPKNRLYSTASKSVLIVPIS
jgi:uncharacterized protein (DUF433 family)